MTVRRSTAAQSLGIACLLHGLVVGGVWWQVSSGLLLHGQPGNRAVALGRLAGLMVSSAVLLQLLLVSRLPWLEPTVGCDQLFRLHRRLGFTIAPLFLAHPGLLIVGYARRHHLSLAQQFVDLAGNWPYVWLAIVAVVLIVPIVVVSIPVIRRRLTHEAWHVPHLAMYAAVGLALLHQLNGAELSSGPWMAAYWVALHVLVIGCFVGCRIGRPVLSFARHRFRIDSIVSESDDVCSVYVTGRRLDRFTFRPGQYANVVFLTKRRWAPHPFSFSAAPNGRFLRLSIKAAGDFTSRIPELTPGTFVVIEGPLGAFTTRLVTRHKYLMVAGGIGITPIRALIESLAAAHRDVVLLYAVKTAKDLVFASELRALTARCHFILSRSAETRATPATPGHPVNNDGHEHGRIDQRMLTKLVPDVADREVFVCGPPPMMTAVIADLRGLQVRQSQIHYEQFA
jgi:predicted ferric reductase